MINFHKRAVLCEVTECQSHFMQTIYTFLFVEEFSIWTYVNRSSVQRSMDRNHPLLILQDSPCQRFPGPFKCSDMVQVYNGRLLSKCAVYVHCVLLLTFTCEGSSVSMWSCGRVVQGTGFRLQSLQRCGFESHHCQLEIG